MLKAMSQKDDFASDDRALDLDMSCYAVSDSLAHDAEPSFLCDQLKKVVNLNDVKNFNVQDFGAALFECFKRPDMASELNHLHEDHQQVAVIPAEKRETGEDLPPILMGKVPEVIREGLDKVGLCLRIVPERPPISRLIDDSSNGYMH